MRALSAFEDVDIDELVPRSYYIYDINQFREFLNDYVLSAARVGLQQWLSGHKPSTASSLLSATVQLRVCERLLARVTESRGVIAAVRAGGSGAGHSRSIAWEARVRALQADPPLLESHGEWVALYGKKRSNHRFPKCVQNVMTETAIREGQLEEGGMGAQELQGRASAVLEELQALLPQASLDGAANCWIVKSVGLSRGRGIKVISELSEVIEYCRKKKFRAIVQKYIEAPMLCHQYKFDLRQWVVVTSWNPLHIWMYSEFYVRFGSYEYSMDDLSAKVRCVWLQATVLYIDGAI
eukprot:TRINITY_DN12496_c0_g3_i1.p1 TRINITY_DN12496_c0_g3~~TRINITY_DN12496_c0_g3_i1.p1  ORF type:complete len:296 (+),score=76.21 TRINITY_DN12496_c0_g3_i1:382-1269(+)